MPAGTQWKMPNWAMDFFSDFLSSFAHICGFGWQLRLPD
jgi:hypothetical protein